MSDTGAVPSYFDSVPPADGPLGTPSDWAGIINPDYEIGPVFTEAQLAEARNSPLMAGLGIDLTQPPPDFLAGTGLTPSHDLFDFGQYSKVMAMPMPFGLADAAPPGRRGGEVSDMVYRPVFGQTEEPPIPLPSRPNDPIVIRELGAPSGGTGQGPSDVASAAIATGQEAQPGTAPQGGLPSSANDTAPDKAITNRDESQAQDSDVSSAAQNAAGSTVPGANGNITQAPSDAAAKKTQLGVLKDLLTAPGAEGRRNDVYLDSRNIPTVGIGHKVQPGDNLKVGDVVSDERVDQLFQQDGSGALAGAQAQAAKAGIVDPDFIPNLASVNFQLGSAGWTKKFPKTWQMIKDGKYEEAAQALDGTPWEKQTPTRVAAFQEALRALAQKPGP